MRASLILGAGPGGTGPLIAAAQHGLLRDWLDRGIAMIERAEAIGGTIGRYVINSDSLGAAYLECLDAPPARALLAPLREAAVTRELEQQRLGFPPLPLVGDYLARLGSLLQQAVAASASSEFMARTEIRALHLQPDGSVAAETLSPCGERQRIEARTAILALGGRQLAAEFIDCELLPSVRLGDIDPAKLILSDTLFQQAGLARAKSLLARASDPRVVIIGGRHSAFSAAWLLLTQCGAHFCTPGQIAILCRRVAPVFYATRAEAEADGCIVSESDICPRTRRVHRFGGMRGDGRELWRRIAGKPGTAPEQRVEIVPLTDAALTPRALRDRLDAATLVIPAFGYRAATVPIFDCEGRRLALRADQGGAAVGADARLLLANGRPLPNVFGIGLGSGFQPSGAMGGEANRDGQTNSLWLYQNDIGALVYRGVAACLASRRENGALPLSAA